MNNLTPKIASNFSMDVTYTILTLLPVKSLLRFRCVCKAWRDLIDSPDFVKSHLDCSLKTNSNHSLVYTSPDYSELYSVHLDTFPKSSLVPTPIEFPVMKVRSIIGARNGLVCIESDRFLVLCNPSTRVFRCVHYPEGITHKCFGFGYDSNGDDYKIVGLSRETTFVYSLRDDSWRSALGGDQVDHITGKYPAYLMCLAMHGVLVDNRLHWIEDRQGNQVMVFDLCREKWSRLTTPNHRGWLLQLGVFDGCLCVRVATKHPTIRSASKCDIWTMKDYGVKESWTKLFTMDGEGKMPVARCNEQTEVIFSRRWIRNNDFIGQQKEFFKGEIKNVDELCDLPELTLCVDSLTPITHAPEKKKRGDLWPGLGRDWGRTKKRQINREVATDQDKRRTIRQRMRSNNEVLISSVVKTNALVSFAL